jgi:hypothetical protein
MRLSFPIPNPNPPYFAVFAPPMFEKCLNGPLDSPLLTETTTRFEKLSVSSDFYVISFLIPIIDDFFYF